MEKTYLIEDCKIKVSFGTGIVHITNDDELSKLLSKSLLPGSDQLVEAIKKDYLEWNEKELQVSDSSLIVEIWGHVYFDYFANTISRMIPLKLAGDFGAFVTERCEVIDSGEAKIDNNRKFWDLLAPHRNLIAGLLRAI